jgi:hypothetical protein
MWIGVEGFAVSKLSTVDVLPDVALPFAVASGLPWTPLQDAGFLGRALSKPEEHDAVPALRAKAAPKLSESLSKHFRTGRDHQLRELILERRAHVAGTFQIADLGGTADYWRRVGFDWLRENQIEITCVNHYATEFKNTGGEIGGIRFVVGNACDLAEHADNSFDFIHSNSVIEHVGRWPEMRAFAREVNRLGLAYYVQTPYYWFPIDPHFYRAPFFHWLPESIRLKLLQKFQLGWAPAQPDVHKAMNLVMSNILLDTSQFKALFPDAEHSYERVCGVAKSLIAVKRQAF